MYSYKHDSIDNIACNRGSGLFFTLMSVCSTWPILVMTLGHQLGMK